MKRHYRIPLKRENLRLLLMELRLEFRKAYKETLKRHMDAYRQALVDKAAASIAEDLEKERRRAEAEMKRDVAQAAIDENERIAKLLTDLDPDVKTAKGKSR